MTTMRGTLMGVLAAAAALCPVQSQAGGVHVGIVLTGGDDYHYRGRERYREETYRRGHDRGLQDGWNRGYEDGRRGRHFGYADDNSYRCADAGYRGHYGARTIYASGYRNGYEESYRRGFAQGRRQCRIHHDHDRYDRDWDRDGRYDRDRHDNDDRRDDGDDDWR